MCRGRFIQARLINNQDAIIQGDREVRESSSQYLQGVKSLLSGLRYNFVEAMWLDGPSKEEGVEFKMTSSTSILYGDLEKQNCRQKKTESAKALRQQQMYLWIRREASVAKAPIARGIMISPVLGKLLCMFKDISFLSIL